MFAPAYFGSANRIDIRSVAEMRRVLMPAEDDATRTAAAKAAIRSVLADFRKGGLSQTPEALAEALFSRFKTEKAAARKA